MLVHVKLMKIDCRHWAIASSISIMFETVSVMIASRPYFQKHLSHVFDNIVGHFPSLFHSVNEKNSFVLLKR